MKLLYFASVRQKTGVGEEEFALPANVGDVAALVDVLRKRGAGYAEAFRETSLLCCAVNQQHVAFDAHVDANDEVAFFPPVTGG